MGSFYHSLLVLELWYFTHAPSCLQGMPWIYESQGGKADSGSCQTPLTVRNVVLAIHHIFTYLFNPSIYIKQFQNC